jgi:sugar (pentulose or hexulose) kinase
MTLQDRERIKSAIESGKTYLGIELGSTRIKAVLIDGDHMPVASGSHAWENTLAGGIWTYSLEEIWRGIRDCYARLCEDVRAQYGVTLTKPGAIGFSGMMHGYMVFDSDGNLLVPFRTWRNTITGQASEKLTAAFSFNIPQRWSIAHLYQAILNGEEHVSRIAYMTTLSGYIHWQLTGEKLVGVGEASGMFPIDAETGQFDGGMIGRFNELLARNDHSWKLEDILPGVLPAGEKAGSLTEKGARLLDPAGALCAGIPVCPPEGDAGTGMAATNSVARRTGNVSAGTSIFAMIVLEKKLSRVYPEIDLVTTPSGDPVAMVHCNTCTSDIDAWAGLFADFAEALGARPTNDKLFELLYRIALEGDDDCGGLLSYNYFSGEPVTGLDQGRPLLIRTPDSRMTLANFMKAQLFAALGALKIGMDILTQGEKVEVTGIAGHGGFFKVGDTGQRFMAAALKTPVTVMQTAGEGGPWGMAILAAYMRNRQPGEALEEYLENRVFKQSQSATAQPEPALASSFEAYMTKYIKGLAAERAAVESI